MISLVKNSLGILLMGLSLFGACKSPEALPADQLSLGVNKSARVGTNITVRVDTLSDNRCPIDAICIQAGEASVSLSLSKGDRTEKRKLSIPSLTENRVSSTTVQFGNRQYKVILQAVTPYPGEDTSDKRAIIQVSKL